MATNRRSFLKFLGLGSLGYATNIRNNPPQPVENTDFLVKEWAEEGVTYLEYLFPHNFQALFKSEDRKRAVYCPIRRLNVQLKKELINIDKSSCVSDGMMEFNDIVMDTIGYEEVTEELLISQIVGYAKNHIYGSSRWPSVYVYIVRVQDHPELFGIMLNKERLIVETDAYTVY